jgi:hypothetical protein
MSNEEVREQPKPMQPQTMGLAVAAMVCGILGFFPYVGFVLAILGIVFGAKARSAIAASAGTLKGEGMAMAGLVCGIVALGIGFLWLILLGMFAAVSSGLVVTIGLASIKVITCSLIA